MKKPKKTTKKLNARNSKILHETITTLGTLKEESDALEEIEINEIQVHLLDEDGDGVILCLEYDEQTGELNRTFSTSEDYYTTEGVEVELEEPSDAPHYYGENELDPCISPENVKEMLDTMIEKTISEEYDEIFHSSDNDDEEPPPLLN